MCSVELPGYSISYEIGHGSFSRVYAAVHRLTGCSVAIKVINKSGIDPKQLDREIRAVKSVDHPNIVSIFEIAEDDRHVYLVSELITGGSLADMLDTSKRLDQAFAKDLFGQIVSAMDYLHNTKHITHRDLKCENIMIAEPFAIRIIDFGFCVCQDSDPSMLMHTRLGSPAYVSPEVIKGEPYSSKTDIWSLGVILYQMMTGELPFADTTVTGVMKKIVESELKIPAGVPSAAADLIERMLEKDAEKRITMKEIRAHEWLFNQWGFIAPKIDTETLLLMIQDFGIRPEELVKGFDMGSFDSSTAILRILRHGVAETRRNSMSMSSDDVLEHHAMRMGRKRTHMIHWSGSYADAGKLMPLKRTTIMRNGLTIVKCERRRRSNPGSI